MSTLVKYYVQIKVVGLVDDIAVVLVANHPQDQDSSKGSDPEDPKFENAELVLAHCKTVTS